MIVFATIPVGLTGVALEHTFRTLFAKPSAAAVLLFVNGLILAGAELLRRSARRRGQHHPLRPLTAHRRAAAALAPASLPPGLATSPYSVIAIVKSAADVAIRDLTALGGRSLAKASDKLLTTARI
jgi:undecaprenyl pyrophosphate phosphatase UppP